MQTLHGRADSAWYAIDSLQITKLFSAYDFRVGIFEYNRSVGMPYSPTYAPNWIVFLYYNSIVTNLSEMENKTDNLSVYPNPAVDKLTVTYPNISNKFISIYNLQGQLLIRKEIGYFIKSADIDIKDLTKGMYILRLENDECILTSKFIKE